MDIYTKREEALKMKYFFNNRNKLIADPKYIEHHDIEIVISKEMAEELDRNNLFWCVLFDDSAWECVLIFVDDLDRVYVVEHEDLEYILNAFKTGKGIDIVKERLKKYNPGITGPRDKFIQQVKLALEEM